MCHIQRTLIWEHIGIVMRVAQALSVAFSCTMLHLGPGVTLVIQKVVLLCRCRQVVEHGLVQTSLKGGYSNFVQPACFGAGCYIEMATSYH